MAISLVPGQETGLANGTTTATLSTPNFASNPTVGNYVLVWAWGVASTALTSISFSDSIGGNTWVIPANSFQNPPSGQSWCAIGYALINSTGAGFNVTVTLDHFGTINICAAEFAGIASSSPQDGTAVGANTAGVLSNPQAPGSMNVSAGDLTVALLSCEISTLPSITPPTGFTQEAVQLNGSSRPGQAVYAIGLSSPSNPSWSMGSCIWACSQFALLQPSITVTPPVWLLKA